MEIAIDFDGTMVYHSYPHIGEPAPNALEVVRKLQEKGHRLILWTMRSDARLAEAVEYMTNNGIKLFGINNNPEQKLWTNSPKAYAQIFIDDAALGCPLVYGVHDRPFVDWVKVEKLLIEMGIL